MDRNTLIFIGGVVGGGVVLLVSGLPFVSGLLVAVASFTLLWLISLPLENAGIVDLFWGPGFVIIGWYYVATVPESPTTRGVLTAALVTIWGVRLALHIGIRNAGAGEDFRYAKWRQESGPRFWWLSYFKVFLLQAVVLWIVSSPLLLAQLEGADPALGVLEMAGLGLWAFGVVFEAVADLQLVRFKRDPANAGRVMQSGLWSLSRHPNYFGEAVLWWGIGLVALSVGGWLALLGPLLITFLLLRISGVALLDRALIERRPGYAEYVESTSAFFPMPRWRRPKDAASS